MQIRSGSDGLRLLVGEAVEYALYIMQEPTHVRIEILKWIEGNSISQSEFRQILREVLGLRHLDARITDGHDRHPSSTEALGDLVSHPVSLRVESVSELFHPPRSDDHEYDICLI